MLLHPGRARIPVGQWLSFRLALRHLASNLRRLSATVFAVAAGVALVVAVYQINGAVLRSFLDTVDALAGRAALTVAARDGFTFREGVLEAVASRPGVRLAVPLVRSVAFPDDGSGEPLTVMGVDLANEAAVRVYHDAERPADVVDDLIAFLNQPDSIIVSREWAAERGLTTGDPLDLVTPSGVRRFVVRGLIEPQGLARALGGRVIVMDIYAAQRAFTENGFISQIDLVIDPDVPVAAVQADVERVLPAGVFVREPAMRREVLRTTIRGFQSMLLVFAFLAAFAGLVICYSRLRSLFDARIWEVGLYRAIGLPRGAVLVELLKESAVLGCIGILIGLPVGTLIARWMFPSFAKATALNFRLPVATAAPAWTPGAIALGVVVGLLAALLAAFLPAYRLAAMEPVAALRLRGLSMPRLAVGSRLALAAALFGGGVLFALVQQLTHAPELGMLTTALFVVGTLALSTPLVVYGARVLRRVYGGLLGTVGDIAGATLAHQPGRSTLAISTLGIGLGAVLFFGILGWSFERSLVAQLGARFRADIVINSAFVSEGWVAAPLREEVVDEVAAVPGVTGVIAQHLKDVETPRGIVSLFSYDARCFRDERLCRWPLAPGAEADALARVAAGDGVLVSVTVAREQGIGVGDAITLDSPGGPRRLRVVGIPRDEPAKAVVMAREAYRRMWNDRTVTWIHAALADPASGGAVARDIARRLGERHRLQVRRMKEFLDFLAGQVRQAFSLLYAMEAVTFLLVLCGIADTLAAGVMERTRQFGMMRAVGLSRARVYQLVLIEGASLGLLGTALALVVGMTLSVFWVYVQFPALLGWNLTLELPVRFIVAGGVLSMVLALTGALGPSLRAARLPVPAALREE